MGAFGELLESHFGGTRHDVRTWKKTAKPEKTPEQIERENKELDQKTFEVFTQGCKERMDRVKMMFDMFKTNKFEEDFLTDEYKEKFSKWKDQFISDSMNKL